MESCLCIGFILVSNEQLVGPEGIYYHRLYWHPHSRNCMHILHRCGLFVTFAVRLRECKIVLHSQS